MGPFKAYDIRGVYGTDVTPELAYKVGLSLRNRVGDRIAIGRDCRMSGEALKCALSSGILASGSDVYDLGAAPSPAVYFSVVRHNLSGGVVVTASHNPPEYNGMKIVGRKALSLSYEAGLSQIEQDVEAGQFSLANWQKTGRSQPLKWSEEYVEALLRGMKLDRILSVVVDVGNGMGGVIESALEALDLRAKCLFKEPDGTFPHHIPDPLREETLEVLKQHVTQDKADIGIALDGDCDRVGFVDEKGRAVGGDASMMIFAEDVLSRVPGSELIVNVLASKAVSEHISGLGGKTRMVRVGHSYIMSELLSSGAKMAGELSGHFYFLDRYLGFDDGIYAALRMVEIVSKSGRRLSEMVDSLPSYHSSPEIRIRCAEDQKPRVMEAFRGVMSELDLKVLAIDGLRLEARDGWAIVRPSNTEPVLVLRFEGIDSKSLSRIKEQVAGGLELASSKAGVRLDLSAIGS